MPFPLVITLTRNNFAPLLLSKKVLRILPAAREGPKLLFAEKLRGCVGQIKGHRAPSISAPKRDGTERVSDAPAINEGAVT